MILLAGATGALGQRIAQRLCERGEPVRALVRPQSDSSELEALGVEIARGDLLDPASLRSACERVRTVISTATAISRLLSRATGSSIREVDEAGAANLIAAAQEAGVERFVYVSYADVDAGIGFPLERAKRATEKRLHDSPLRAVVIRPDAFQDVHLAPIGQFDLRQGRVGILGKGDTKRRFVSTDDVAALIAAVAVEPDPPELIEFGGPEALTRNQAIEIAERATGRTLKRRRLPRPIVRLATRLLTRPKPAVASILGLGLLIDTHAPRWDDTPLTSAGSNQSPRANTSTSRPRKLAPR